jgi:hemerythrin-like metal-binding protein
MLSWDADRHGLGIPAMDKVHREFLTLARETLQAGAEDFPILFEALRDHTAWHFSHEGELMRACGFPAIAEHEGEHRRILGDLDRLLRGIDEGRSALARHYLREGLFAWFEQHAATMDAALAGCLKR